MNGKRMLGLLLAVCVGTAALSILAEGSVTGPAPDPADLPTADAWTDADEAELANAVTYADEAELANAATHADEAELTNAATHADEAELANAATYAVATEYDTEAESVNLKSFDSGETTPDALITSAAVTEAESVGAYDPGETTPDAVGTSAAAHDAVTVSDTPEGVIPADTPQGVGTLADTPEGVIPVDTPQGVGTLADTPEGVIPVDTPQAQSVTKSDAPQVVVTPADMPEASDVAGPDDGGERPERTLDKNERRDAQKREQITRSATEKTETLSEITFAEVESRTREDNMTVRALRESVEGLEGMDYKKSEEELVKVLNALSVQQDMLGMVSNEPLARSFAVSSLQSQYDSLYSTFEKLRDGTTRRSGQDAIEQMRDAMNQVVMGAETLYIALVAMEDQHTALTRQLEALNRTVEEMELRYRLGQISALTLNQTKAGRRALVSGMETLEMNIRAYKMRLENLLGASLTGEIALGGLPAVTEAQIAALDIDRDFAAAQEKSYELYAAARTLQDAKETFLDAGEQYNHNESNASYNMARRTWAAAQDTYNVTVRGYELKFRTLYEQANDYYQVWNASKDALETQKLEYQAKELQYKQGNISKNALLSAEDALREKEEAVTTAANNLFSAYNNYCWAAQTGILT